jgi:flavodoxin
MKRIFIYYSLSGNGDAIADYLKEKKIDIRKVETLKPLPKNRVLQIIIGGYKAMRNYKDKLSNFDNDISKYDEIIIGTPIWNARLSSPINTVLEELDLKDKKIIFLLYSGSGTGPKAKEYIIKKYPNSTIIELQEPKKNPQEMEKITI